MVTILLVAALVAQAAAYRIDPASAEAGFDLKATAHTVHGTTTAVSGEVQVIPEAAADGSVASGTFDVTWADFGVPGPSFFVVRIEKVAHVHFRATFVPVP